MYVYTFLQNLLKLKRKKKHKGEEKDGKLYVLAEGWQGAQGAARAARAAAEACVAAGR